jgi:hypothetical protein
VHRVMYALVIGFVAVAALVAAHPGAGRARSASDAGAEDDRTAWEAAFRRTRGRIAAAVALVRGELTVPEAVARFRALLADDPVALRGLGAKYAGAPIDELAARQAASYVDQYGDEDPARRNDLVRQLNALAEHKSPTAIDVLVSNP